MAAYGTMSFHLRTDRLNLRPWTESDTAELRALRAERGEGTSTVEYTRTFIANLLTATETTGIALPPIQRSDEDDFIGYCDLIIGRSTLEEPEIAYELFQRAHRSRLYHRGGRCGARRRCGDREGTALGDRRRMEHTVVPRP